MENDKDQELKNKSMALKMQDLADKYHPFYLEQQKRCKSLPLTSKNTKFMTDYPSLKIEAMISAVKIVNLSNFGSLIWLIMKKLNRI